MSKYPIDLIEVDFVQKRMPFADIIDKYGISMATLSYHSKKLSWMKKRKGFNKRVREKIMTTGVKQEAKEQKTLIERLETLLYLKLEAETKVFLSEKDRKKDKATSKEIMYLINKSKDPVGELTKIIELLKGNATDRVEIDKKEKAVRYNRLKDYMTVG